MLVDQEQRKPHAEVGCAAIHTALEWLPLLGSPGDVPFADGLYFFCEDGETSQHALRGRIVRVGNHPRSDGTLRRRLRNHYKGNKNGSVFRRLLGGALLRRRDPDGPCLAPSPGKGHWEHQKDKACECCQPLEEEVSQLLRSSFRFRCVMVKDRAERNELEEVLIATLAACPVCGPSTSWLGRHAYSENVQLSGMWNSEFVGGPPITAHQLQRFQSLARASVEAFDGRRYLMTATKNAEGSGTKRSTLFVTHCSGEKNPAGGDPLTLYESARIRRFGAMCDDAGVSWAIFSAEYALFFPDEQHDVYDTTLHFRSGHLHVYGRERPLAPPESEAHVQRLVQAVRVRLAELSFNRVEFYLEGRRPIAYLLVMHIALDGCIRGHRSADEVLKCIETAGRVHLVSGSAALSASLTPRRGDHSQTSNDEPDAAIMPTEAERAPGRVLGKPLGSKDLGGPRRDTEEIWQRIQAQEGKEFSQKGGKRFWYSVMGSYLRPSTTNQNIPKRHFEEALSLVPLEGPGQINHLRGPSYIFAILMDGRIRLNDW